MKWLFRFYGWDQYFIVPSSCFIIYFILFCQNCTETQEGYVSTIYLKNKINGFFFIERIKSLVCFSLVKKYYIVIQIQKYYHMVFNQILHRDLSEILYFEFHYYAMDWKWWLKRQLPNYYSVHTSSLWSYIRSRWKVMIIWNHHESKEKCHLFLTNQT